jgi:hypothetical protein
VTFYFDVDVQLGGLIREIEIIVCCASEPVSLAWIK